MQKKAKKIHKKEKLFQYWLNYTFFITSLYLVDNTSDSNEQYDMNIIKDIIHM